LNDRAATIFFDQRAYVSATRSSTQLFWIAWQAHSVGFISGTPGILRPPPLASPAPAAAGLPAFEAHLLFDSLAVR
jgi:hypothetical protein